MTGRVGFPVLSGYRIPRAIKVASRLPGKWTDSDGRRLRSTSANTRLNYNYYWALQPFNFFEASRDGRRIAMSNKSLTSA